MKNGIKNNSIINKKIIKNKNIVLRLIQRNNPLS